MFKNIYLFELKSWMGKVSFYLYMVGAFIAGLLSMASGAGAFDGSTVTVTSLTKINAPLSLLQLVAGLTVIAFLFLPSMVGATIHKDFKYNVHKVMYSFPFSKPSYFFAKFFSGFTVALLFVFAMGLGIMLGTIIPTNNAELLAPFNFGAYLKSYALFIIPNTFIFSCFVFAVVTFSRNIVAGFVAMIAFFIFQGFGESLLNNMDWKTVAAMVDPFGMTSVMNHSEYWTISELNENSIPFSGTIIYNRILWMAIGLLILIGSYFKFQFHTEHQGFSLFRRKRNAEATQHKTFSLAQKINLPEVKRSFGISQGLSSAWKLSKIDLKYILTGGPFIVITIIGLIFLVLMIVTASQFMQTPTLPTTKQMLLIPGTLFSIFITFITIIYGGLIINRKFDSNIYQLQDSTASPTWSFILSKVISLTIMQMILLLAIMIAGVGYQLFDGYTNLELGLYLRDLYLIKLPTFLPWTLLVIFAYTLIPNFYLSLIAILAFYVGINFLSRLGIEQTLFKFNRDPRIMYSDLDGYGVGLSAYYIYRTYWVLFGLVLLALASMLWRRGMSSPFLKRLKEIKNGINIKNLTFLILSLIGFLGIGGWIYHHDNTVNQYTSSKEREKKTAQYEKTYKRYEDMAQPRLISTYVAVDLFTKTFDFEVNGEYTLTNKTNEKIDTVYIDHSNSLKSLEFDRGSILAKKDTAYNIRLYKLNAPLFPGDTMKMSFALKNKPNTLLRIHAPVQDNGTFFNNGQFPQIGYQEDAELTLEKVREKYGLEPKEIMGDPNDPKALANTYISNFADWIDFEIKITTDADQIAMAPGKLIGETENNGRKTFHYKMDQKMLNFYNISSARYEVLKDKWNDVELSIYYHKGHEYNLDRMMSALKDGLSYYTENYSPFQFDQLRILEFPRASFAQSFANTVPFSENIGFVAKVDDSDEGGVDFPYAVTAHELAHQWWAHQVIGAKAKGATMLSESLSEYSSLKVLEKKYGKGKMRKFLKDALDKYLQARSLEQRGEKSLVANENQQHIHYQKGSLAFYALSDLMGEKALNNVLSAYIDSVGFQDPPYTTAPELMGMLYEAAPDSLHYFLEDMFETITLYDNRIAEADYVMNDDSTYTVNITAQVRKYRTDAKGKASYKNMEGDSLVWQQEGKKKPTQSLPLEDYMDLVIFGAEEVDDKTEETVLYEERIKASDIENKFTITVDAKPVEVGIDPYNKLIDRNSGDNRRKLKK